MENPSYAVEYTPPKWWNDPRFSLVPRLRWNKVKKPINEYDSGTAKGFSFQWLFIRTWTLEHFALSLEATIDDHWGIGLVGTLFYLRWAVCIPIHQGTFNFLRRKP